jgi:hypothetical protein
MKLQCFGSWIFFRLQVKRKNRNPTGAQQLGFLFSFLSEDGGRSVFRNIVILIEI